MTRPHRLAALIALAAACLSAASPAAGAPERPETPDKDVFRLAAFGNSLMGNIRLPQLAALAQTRGHKLYSQGAGGPGFPIEFVWKARAEQVREILAKPGWDGIMLQPFLRSIDTDLASIGKFMDLASKHSPNITLYLYAQFTNDIGVDYQDLWLQDASQYIRTGEQADHNYKANRCRDFYEALTRKATQAHPDHRVVMVPVGHAFSLLDYKIKAGQVPGIDSVFQLWADGTHVNNAGSYLTAMTWYAVLFHESPVGLPVTGFQGSPDVPYDWVITPAQAKILQQTAWQVAATHPLAKVRAEQRPPLEIATPGIFPKPVAGESYRFELTRAFGTGPCTWTVADGALPTGLSLTRDGVVEGKPTCSEQKRFTLRVTDAQGAAAEKAFALNVETDTAPTIVAERSDLGTVSAGQLVRIKLQATGGNGRLRWDFARLRRNEKTAHGLRMLGDGLMVGAVGAPGRYEFHARVTDSDLSKPESDEKTFTLTVTQPEDDVLLVPAIARDRITPNWQLRKQGGDWQSKYVAQYDFPAHPVTQVVRGKAFDNDVRFQAVLPNHIVFAVFVKDDAISIDRGDPSQGDSVELYLDVFNDREKVYNADDRRVIVTPDGKVSGFPGHKTRVFVHPTEDGYFVRVTMPGHDLKRKLEPGAVMGFDIAVNDRDADDGPVSTVMWHGQKLHTESLHDVGTLILTDGTDRPTGAGRTETSR